MEYRVLGSLKTFWLIGTAKISKAIKTNVLIKAAQKMDILRIYLELPYLPVSMFSEIIQETARLIPEVVNVIASIYSDVTS